jgi:hypothetical protein
VYDYWTLPEGVIDDSLSFDENIANAMNRATRIHFNTTGFDLGRYNAFLENPVFTGNNATNLELYKIYTTEAIDKTMFYGPGLTPLSW